MTFMPPPVDPELPPINIRVRSTALAREGHWSKSAVAKPVVVNIDET